MTSGFGSPPAVSAAPGDATAQQARQLNKCPLDDFLVGLTRRWIGFIDFHVRMVASRT
ncbi:hypothetical protein [Acidiphilium multivorum]|uniref:hypothetical protein n=1 Tax=Acidiphilium multivorum TaxID=62140 RepID=UPI001B8B8795|nr:hypothetical protein [Acidiphilium multivorum]MBS3025437.1 hypothetical protein [Acidiphilium multivorum]